MRGRARRAHKRRFRGGRKRALPSLAAAHRYLRGFIERAAEAKRGAGRAYVPSASEALQGLRQVNADFL